MADEIEGIRPVTKDEAADFNDLMLEQAAIAKEVRAAQLRGHPMMRQAPIGQPRVSAAQLGEDVS